VLAGISAISVGQPATGVPARVAVVQGGCAGRSVVTAAHLAGDKAWWLHCLLPNGDVEGAALERRHHQDGGESAPEPLGDRASTAV
jgi:hypothetical protein